MDSLNLDKQLIKQNNMKLNKSQRFTAYCIMLAEFELDKDMYEDCGFCFLIKNLMHEIGTSPSFYVYTSGIFKRRFPELYKRNPRNGGWWYSCDNEGWYHRIKLLKQCIIETHP